MKKVILTVVLVLLAVYVLPLNKINWGKVTWQPAETVTVSGTATTQETNQIASFSAGVMVQNMDKNKAITEVNSKTDELIKAVKDFGIVSDDIQTQNLSYYQEPKGSTNPGQWQVNNSVEITLRDVAKASQLADLLAKTGATNVYGPNFRLDENNKSANGLFGEAIKDAKIKADSIAKASGRTLGKVLSVTEGSSSSGIYPTYDKAMGVGGGVSAPIEPGSVTVSKTVTVVWELK
jgi:uncharacterized protein